jgi:uncharacterized protein (TIGR02452 family)
MEKTMSLKEIANKTLQILEQGQYTAPSGKIVEFSEKLHAAVAGTILYTPKQALNLLETPNDDNHALQTTIQVTNETTQMAARRLVQDEKCDDLVLLNFASARNPGGGFINGAKAQEEDIARCSGLYPCLLTQPMYYETNRSQSSLLYTDHLIYSPKVPWFRQTNRDLLENDYTASIITAPAPNAGQALRRDADAMPKIEASLKRRTGMVLAVARQHAHRSILLGAWGCGVFRNDPKMVADAFGVWLESRTFRGYFDRVIFAVYDTHKNKKTLSAFQERFR